MDITKFNEKLDKVDGNVYTIEEIVEPIDGVYESELIHDNVTSSTINIYTGSKLTGDKINTYTISTPSLTPWKTVIKIFSNEPKLYITYETTGDTVEAEDVNNLQDSVNLTQESLNDEVTRATNAEKVLTDNLDKEILRAKEAESTITTNLNAEVDRAKSAEQTLTTNLNNEINRAKSAENTLTTNLATEVDRATSAEQTLTNTINTNKPIWDDKYTKNEVDNKISQVITDLDWKESVTTYDDLATTYPNPDDGWTVNVKDTDITYRWSGSAWVAISANSIPLATSTTDGKMSKEDKVNLDDVNAKKHTHDNKSILDTITQTLINNWNSAFTHISDAVRHITSAERTLWNTVSDKLNLSGGTLTGKLTITGTAESKPLNVRGINGISTDGTTDDALYLNYGTTNPVYVNGSNAVYHGGNKPTKSDVGLANVDNTSDLNKPISTATQTALDGKLSLTGGTLTGTLKTTKEKWFTDGTSGIHMNNSDIRGINSLVFNDECGTGEGLYFPKNSTVSDSNNVSDYDLLNSRQSNLLYNENKVYHEGNKPTKSDIGLGNVDNTSDLDKPVSTATQTALNGKANSSHTHTKSQITDMPTSLKNPNALTISLNGTSQGDYDGSSAKSINITPSSIGASATSHTHDDRYYTETECDTKFATKDELSASGNGDMLKSIYDTNSSGVVDKAEKLSTARTITIGSTGKTFDGSSNITWSLSEIGASSTSHTHDDRYYTESEIDTKLNAKVNKAMTWNELEGV